MLDYFERKLRLKDLEIWDIRFSETVYRMAVIDENRFPELSELDVTDSKIEDDLRKNIINVRVYSTDGVKEEHIEEIDQFAKQLTDHVALAHCHVVVKFYNGGLDESVNLLLKEKYGFAYENIPLDQLWHFNQG